MTPMANVDVRDYVALMEVKAGFVEVETGPTSSKLLSFVRGQGAGKVKDARALRSSQTRRAPAQGCHEPARNAA